MTDSVRKVFSVFHGKWFCPKGLPEVATRSAVALLAVSI